MCEDGSDVEALAYLQTEVGSVVNHDNAEEAINFRSLLSHLLALPSRSKPTSAGNDAMSHSEPPSTLSEQPPRKRSRPLSLSDKNAASSTVVDRDDTMTTESDSSNVIPRSVVRLEEDPTENDLHSGTTLSGERYKQRTEVFERLLQFVNEEAKQPQKDLLDLVDMDEDI